jgi:hypothetical protein
VSLTDSCCRKRNSNASVVTGLLSAGRLLSGWWWAHFAFTRINIEPIIRRKKIEDLREAEALGLLRDPCRRFRGHSARKQDSPRVYSWRSATTGSIFIARRAGT